MSGRHCPTPGRQVFSTPRTTKGKFQLPPPPEYEQLRREAISHHSSFNMSQQPQPPSAPPRVHQTNDNSAGLKIAILLNSYRSPFIADIRDSYTRSIAAVSPDAVLTFFYPAEIADHFPDPDLFDLIVIGGGNADPRKKHAWILRVHRFILDVVTNFPTKKLCGICWGHQTISMLFGGEVVDLGVPELGVTEAKLTPLGQRFFTVPFRMGIKNEGTVRLQQHHRRAVGTPPRGFYELMAGNQAFLSHNGAILTFQGHPEKDARAARVRIRDAARWFGTDMGDARAVAELVERMEMQHDGLEVWRRVLMWAAGEGDGDGAMRMMRI
ncbi:class I glutamine amidotransferase-like protein [Echria macrotheca]|uniref:Class I glutamine amidotransferase-like protein n=1 Tax=Echria macrotheca TaxID=438768 RepID=A0AAJ0FAM9_9PEZI|nr:class I glutamine amidotransferase-like protein [Echria macrotheca]